MTGTEVDRFYKSLGETIRNRRRFLGLTQAQLGEQVHKTVDRVAYIERGRKMMPIHEVMEFAEALECGALELMPEEFK